MLKKSKRILFNMILLHNIYSIDNVHMYKILQNFNFTFKKKIGKKIHSLPGKNTTMIMENHIKDLNAAAEKPFKLLKPVSRKPDVRDNFIDTPELNLITQKLKNSKSDRNRKLCIIFLYFFVIVKIIFILITVFCCQVLQALPKQEVLLERYLVLMFLSVVMDIIAIFVPFRSPYSYGIISVCFILIILLSYYILANNLHIILRSMIVMIHWCYYIIPYLMMMNFEKKSIKQKKLLQKLETFNVKTPLTYRVPVLQKNNKKTINI